MRVALVHDYIKEYGGAERVLEALHEIYPEAPVYTTVYLPQFLGPHRERFKNWKIKTSLLQYLPFKAKLISIFRVISPFVFSRFDFSQYDVVIVSATGAYFPNCIRCHPEQSEGSLYNDQGILRSAQNDNKKNQNDIMCKPVHICYCHTPPRYLYGYMTARDWKNNPVFKVMGEIANHFLRMVDAEASQNVDFYIANSEEVKARIKKFYRRDAIVINPPVNTSSLRSLFQFDDFSNASVPAVAQGDLGIRSPSATLVKKSSHEKASRSEYYLTGGRLARAKGIDIIINAFIKMGKPLKIFGKGFAGFENQLKVQKPKLKVNDIEFLGEVTDEERFILMRNAKAFVFASFDEDFGITPVEAMSVGTPVVAYKSGGVLETVIDGKTGVFYQQNTQGELTKAIRKFEKLNLDPKNCINQAKKFSKNKFKTRIREFIEKV